MDLKSAEQKNNLALIDDKKVSIGSDKSPNIASKLNELIASHISKSKLTYKTFNQFEIGYRSHGDKGFIDWLDLTHGYLFNTGLRGKEQGFFYSLIQIKPIQSY